MSDEAKKLRLIIQGERRRHEKAEARLKAFNAVLLEALEGLQGEIDGLIAESAGVCGLHLNGDDARWDELLENGKFPWITFLPKARAAIAKAKEE